MVMSDGWIKVELNVSDRLLGCDICFHDETPNMRLDESRASEPLFWEVKRRGIVTAHQMISRLFRDTPTQSLVPEAAKAEAFEKGVSVVRPTGFVVKFIPGSFELLDGAIIGDISVITFDVELTIRPKKQS